MTKYHVIMRWIPIYHKRIKLKNSFIAPNAQSPFHTSATYANIKSFILMKNHSTAIFATNPLEGEIFYRTFEIRVIFRQDVLIRHKETVHNTQNNQLKGIDFNNQL